MTNFWNLEKFENQIAIITDTGIKITYNDLVKRIQPVESKLNSFSNRLVFCKCKNDIQTLVNYIAALRSNCPVLLLDDSINKEYYDNLIKTYKPSFILGERIQQLTNDTICYNQLGVLLSTSGSTGNPKLVRLSKKNIQENAISIMKYLSINKEERAVTILPIHYSYGLSVINSHLLVGATILLTEESIISKNFWDFINKEKVTSMAGVPYTYEILKKLRFNRMDIPTLKYMTQAGGRLPINLAEEFTKICNEKKIDFYIMYGQTEAAPRMSFFKTNNNVNKLTSIGKEIPGGKFHLYDDDNNIIEKIGKEGELVYTGPNVMLGYATSDTDLKKEDELKGKLYTGDLAKVDNDGYYYITGRKNRYIKIYGLRINLDDISQFLLRKNIDGIAVGRDDLICIATTSSVDKNMKKMILKEYQLHHSVLKIVSVEEIPKNKAGKILYDKVNDYFK